MKKFKVLLFVSCITTFLNATNYVHELTATNGTFQLHRRDYALSVGEARVTIRIPCEAGKVVKLTIISNFRNIDREDGGITDTPDESASFTDNSPDPLSAGGGSYWHQLKAKDTITYISAIQGNEITVFFRSPNILAGYEQYTWANMPSPLIIHYEPMQNTEYGSFDNLNVNNTLDVKGDAYLRQSIFLQNSSKFIGTAKFDRIGIGTTFPSVPLDVAGVIRAEKIGIGTSNPNAKLEIGTTFGLSVTAANLDRNVSSPYDLSFLKNTGRLLLGWNYAGGTGEQSFISNRGAGDRGGFGFYDYSNTGVMTNLMSIRRISASDANVMLDVYGVVRATEVKVCLNQGCDFVFDKNYNLMPLNDLSNFVTENKHLPEVAPAAEMENNGINLSEMNAKLLQKVEELTLYVIDLQNQIDELKK